MSPRTRAGTSILLTGCAVVAGSACNWFFDLKTTQAVDAAYFDAPIDAPFQCPPIGTLPSFSSVVTQAIPQNCQLYSRSEDRNLAAALCNDDVKLGPLEGPLVPATLTGAMVSSIAHARLTPEGNELWVRRVTTAGVSLSVYTRVDDLTWSYVRDVGVTIEGNDTFTIPTRKIGSVRHFLLQDFSASQLVEYIDDGTTATPVHVYSTDELGTLYVVFPNITADGLRLIFAGDVPPGTGMTQTMYADRASTTAQFGAASPLREAPVVVDPFMTEDCGRLYTWGLGSIFYAQQQ